MIKLTMSPDSLSPSVNTSMQSILGENNQSPSIAAGAVSLANEHWLKLSSQLGKETLAAADLHDSRNSLTTLSLLSVTVTL